MNYGKNFDNSTLTLSQQDILALVTWHEADHPHLSPIGFRRLTRRDIEHTVRAWRQRNGQPQLPVGDFWQVDGEWLQGPNLAGLDFSNLDLTEMDLAGVIFSYVDLQEAKLTDSSMEGAWLFRANLCGAVLKRSNIAKAKFFEADLSAAEMWRANLSGTSFRGANMEGTRLLEADLDGAYFHRARMNNTELMANQLGGSIGEERNREYSMAIEAYSRLKANFESLGRYADAGWAYRKERRMRKKLANQQARKSWQRGNRRQAIKHWLSWASDWFVELLCDYGENVWRVVGWIAVLLFIVGPILVTISGGLVWTGSNRDVYLQLPTAWQRWGYAYTQHVLYTLDTLTTASFSELEPHTDAVRVASGLMAMAGIFLVGLLGFVAGNRIRNS